MKVLVTGARGMLGSLVCSELGPEHEVVHTDVVEGCERLDISDVSGTFDTLDRHRPELVIHCGAMTDVDGCEREPDQAYRINAVGTWNLACACKAHDCAVAYVSTDYVFDGKSRTPYTEFDLTNPISVYGASKLAGEQAVRQLCDKHYIVRTSALFAPRGKNFAVSIRKAAEVNKQLRVVSDQISSPTYAKDLAQFLASLVGSPLYGTYHFTNAGNCSWYEFAKRIIETAGLTDVEVVPIKSEEWPTPTKRPEYSVLRHYRMELLGRDNARPWEEAVAEFISEWTTAKQ